MSEHTPGELRVPSEHPGAVVIEDFEHDGERWLPESVLSIDGLVAVCGRNILGSPGANAARLALCWNCHDDLLAALRAEVDMILDTLSRAPAESDRCDRCITVDVDWLGRIAARLQDAANKATQE